VGRCGLGGLIEVLENRETEIALRKSLRRGTLQKFAEGMEKPAIPRMKKGGKAKPRSSREGMDTGEKRFSSDKLHASNPLCTGMRSDNESVQRFKIAAGQDGS